MIIDLRQLFELVDEQVPVEYDLDLRDYELCQQLFQHIKPGIALRFCTTTVTLI